jgi:hypothetical protein
MSSSVALSSAHNYSEKIDLPNAKELAVKRKVLFAGWVQLEVGLKIPALDGM